MVGWCGEFWEGMALVGRVVVDMEGQRHLRPLPDVDVIVTLRDRAAHDSDRKDESIDSAKQSLEHITLLRVTIYND